jgi:hypothetical protein
MEFRRIEIKKIYRHVESISTPDDVRSVFLALYANNLKFTIRVSGVGAIMRDCIVHAVKEGTVRILSRFPTKVWLEPEFEQIEMVEVVCNREIIASELDEGGRWTRVI